MPTGGRLINSVPSPAQTHQTADADTHSPHFYAAVRPMERQTDGVRQSYGMTVQKKCSIHHWGGKTSLAGRESVMNYK